RRHGRARRPPGRDPPPRVRPGRLMVGIVVVSHSAAVAEGVVELARQMGGEDVPIAAAGGVDDPEHPIGTDATRVQAAIEGLADADGVLVLMDLGSAVLSAELALELLDPELAGRVLLCDAPLVEGAVAAAVAARVGGGLEEVAAEARRGLAPKAAQLGVEEAPAPEAAAEADGDGWAEARIPVPNPLGLHAPPAPPLLTPAAPFAPHALPRRGGARPGARRDRGGDARRAPGPRAPAAGARPAGTGGAGCHRGARGARVRRERGVARRAAGAGAAAGHAERAGGGRPSRAP